jgi:hypothetical protein
MVINSKRKYGSRNDCLKPKEFSGASHTTSLLNSKNWWKPEQPKIYRKSKDSDLSGMKIWVTPKPGQQKCWWGNILVRVTKHKGYTHTHFLTRLIHRVASSYTYFLFSMYELFSDPFPLLCYTNCWRLTMQFTPKEISIQMVELWH